MLRTVVCLFSLAASASAFAPQQSGRPSVELAAGRREVLGAVGVALAGLAGQQLTQQQPTLIAGLKNPALETFKSKNKGQAFIPGKGMHAHEDELIAGLKNPALETFKAKNKGCLLYTSPSPRDQRGSRMPSSA